MKTILKTAAQSSFVGRELYRKCRRAGLVKPGKNDITSMLGRNSGARNYLEVTSTHSGGMFREVDRDYFESAQRLVYRCAESQSGGHNDCLPIDYVIQDSDLSGTIARICQEGPRPEIVLVDAYHSYEESWRDLEVFLDLVPDGGFLVVHDCKPSSKEVSTPTVRRGPWSGVTYAAYLDFVLTRADVDYLTVDCDHGCGVISKAHALDLPRASRGAFPARPSTTTSQRWLARDRSDFEATWAIFEEMQAELLRLTAPSVFFTGVTTRVLGRD